MGVDSILNLTRSFLPDNTMMAQLIDAKAQAQAANSVSSYDARNMAVDAAKVQAADAKVQAAENKAEMLQTMYSMNQGQQQAGFSLNSPTTMLMMGALMLGAVVLIKRPTA